MTARMLNRSTCVPLHVRVKQRDSPYPGVSPERVVAAEVHHGPVTGNTWTASRFHREAASGRSTPNPLARELLAATPPKSHQPIHKLPGSTAGLPPSRPGSSGEEASVQPP